MTNEAEELIEVPEQGTSPQSGTLASSVYDQLRDDLLSGRLKPGEKLRAEYLRERYNVGNSPIREALNRLSADGLVVREDQKGFHVSSVSKEDLAELVKTRCWLEETALRESISNRNVEWEERLVLAFHRVSRVPRSANERSYARNPEWERLHADFHRVMISACGSRWLLAFCDQLRDQADRYRQLAASASFRQRNEGDEHRAIMDAAINGDPDLAVELLKSHYSRTLEIIDESDWPASISADD
jgi:DNA-binding GntR family transcriptional regulator